MKSRIQSSLALLVIANLLFAGCALNRKSSRFAPINDGNQCGCSACHSEVGYSQNHSGSSTQTSESSSGLIVGASSNQSFSNPVPAKVLVGHSHDNRESATMISAPSVAVKETEAAGDGVQDNTIDDVAADNNKAPHSIELGVFDDDPDAKESHASSDEAEEKTKLAEAALAKAEQESAAKLEAAKSEAAKIIEDARAQAEMIRLREIEAAQAEAARLAALAAAAEEEFAQENTTNGKTQKNLLLKKIREQSKSNLLLKPKQRKPNAESMPPSAFNDRQPSYSDMNQDGRIVLRANQVGRKVVSRPLARKVSAKVPAMAASFRRGQHMNGLRGPNHLASPEPAPTAASATIIAHATSEDTEAIVVQPQSENLIVSPPRLVLRAFPLNDSDTLGKHVQARFKLRKPARQSAEMQVKKLPAKTRPESPVNNRVKSLEPSINLNVSDPSPKSESSFERTARKDRQASLAVPPWRK